MHGLNIVINTFASGLLKFYEQVDYENLKYKPYKKYIDKGYKNSKSFTWNISDIKKEFPTLQVPDFIRKDPEFKIRIIFTEWTKSPKALHEFDSNRISIICGTQGFNSLKDCAIARLNDGGRASICHELTHSIDGSRIKKSQLDINKKDYYKDYNIKTSDQVKFNIKYDDIIKDDEKIVSMLYVSLYYCIETERNAYLQTFKEQALKLLNENENAKITEVNTYSRYKFLHKLYIELIDNVKNHKNILEWLTTFGYTLSFKTTNKIANNTKLEFKERLEKILNVVDEHYIKNELHRMQKIWTSIKEKDIT